MKTAVLMTSKTRASILALWFTLSAASLGGSPVARADDDPVAPLPVDVTITQPTGSGDTSPPSVQPPAAQAPPQGPPPNPSFLHAGDQWWGDFFVAAARNNAGQVAAPFRLGQFGMTKTLGGHCSATFRFDPFPWLGGYFEGQLDQPNSPVWQGVAGQMKATAALNGMSTNISAAQIQAGVQAELDPRMKGQQTASGIVREYSGACKDGIIEIKFGKMDDPTTINEAATRPFESSEAVEMTVHLPRGFDLIARTFTDRCGLLDPTGGVVLSYVEGALNPCAVHRGPDGYAQANPAPLPFFDYKFDSFSGSVRYDATQNGLLRALHITEILTSFGSARGAPYAVVNVSGQVGQTLLKFQWAEEAFLPEPTGRPDSSQLNLIGEHAFRNGTLIAVGDYSKTWTNGIQGPGVPANGTAYTGTVIKQVGKQLGPGHFYLMGSAGWAESMTPAGQISGPSLIGGGGFQFGGHPEPR